MKPTADNYDILRIQLWIQKNDNDLRICSMTIACNNVPSKWKSIPWLSGIIFVGMELMDIIYAYSPHFQTHLVAKLVLRIISP
jgi:hypothetical protein